MRLSDEQIQELIDATVGTCSTLEQQSEIHFEVDDIAEYENEVEILEKVDNQIFLCNECNWWFPMSEMSSHEDADWQCLHCVPEED